MKAGLNRINGEMKFAVALIFFSYLSMEILKGDIAEGARLCGEVEGDRIVFKTT